MRMRFLVLWKTRLGSIIHDSFLLYSAVAVSFLVPIPAVVVVVAVGLVKLHVINYC